MTIKTEYSHFDDYYNVPQFFNSSEIHICIFKNKLMSFHKKNLVPFHSIDHFILSNKKKVCFIFLFKFAFTFNSFPINIPFFLSVIAPRKISFQIFFTRMSLDDLFYLYLKNFIQNYPIQVHEKNNIFVASFFWTSFFKDSRYHVKISVYCIVRKKYFSLV